MHHAATSAAQHRGVAMNTATARTESHRLSGSWPPPAIAAAVGFAAFAASVVAAGALDPGYSHVREGISALAATDSPAAWIMITGFLGLAGGTMAAGITLWVRLGTGVAGRIGAAMVTLAGAAMVVVGLNQQDCSDFTGACAPLEAAGTLSTHHMIHQLVSLAVFTVLAVATFPLARGLRRSVVWAHLAVPTRLSGLVAILVIAMLLTVGFGDVAGVVQRLFVALLFGLPVLLAALPGRR
jgi:hypothetical membrane protein